MVERKIIAIRKVQKNGNVSVPSVLSKHVEVVFEYNEDGEIVVRPNHESD